MSAALEDLAGYLKESREDLFETATIAFGELTLTASPETVVRAADFPAG